MNWLPFWNVFCAMLPLDFRLIWIVFLSQLVVTLDSLCLPCYELTCLHVQNTTAHSSKSDECALEYTDTSRRVKLSSSRLQCSRKELLSVAPCSLHPSVASCISGLGIGRQLPKIRSHRAGRRELRKISVLCGRGNRTLPQAQASETLSSLLSASLASAARSVTVHRENLIRVPLQASARSSVSGLHAALFNARFVDTPEKRCEISSYINDNAIDLMFLTETWLRSHGDKAKIADLVPSGYAVKSFPRPFRGGGIAVIFRTSLSSHLTVKADFSFTHTFELVQISVTLQQRILLFFCVYRPPPNRKNRLTNSMFLY